MKFLALEVESPTATNEQFQPLLADEAQAVWQLYQVGVIREMYFRADRHSAVLVLECATLEEAQECLQELPLARASLIAFDIIPLVAYPGFARLFGEKGRRE